MAQHSPIHFSTLTRAERSLLIISVVGAIVGMVECALGIVALLQDPDPVYAASGMDPALGRAMEGGMYLAIAIVQWWLAWMGWGALKNSARLKPLVITNGIVAAFCILALLGELSQTGLSLEDLAFIVPIFSFASALAVKRQ